MSAHETANHVAQKMLKAGVEIDEYARRSGAERRRRSFWRVSFSGIARVCAGGLDRYA
jgi:hypothetical protein